jgi:hypothetical protein
LTEKLQQELESSVPERRTGWTSMLGRGESAHPYPSPCGRLVQNSEIWSIIDNMIS